MSGSRSRDHAEAAGVGDQHLGLGVVEPELELFGLPPRVQRHDDRAEHRARPERHDPLGIVGRQEGDAIADPDAEPGQRRRDRARRPVVLAERQPVRRPGRRSRRRHAPRSAPSARASSSCAACRPGSGRRARLRGRSRTARRARSAARARDQVRSRGQRLRSGCVPTPVRARRSRLFVLHDVERPELAPGAHRPALGVVRRVPAGTPGRSASCRSRPASPTGCTRGTRHGRRSGAAARTLRSRASSTPRPRDSRNARAARRPARPAR